MAPKMQEVIQPILSTLIGCFYLPYVLAGWAYMFITGPVSFFHVKSRDRPPACLTDPKLGIHGFVHLNEVRLHYVASGDEKKPLMLLLHGFPEFWYSWRYQIREFKNDYRVVAIDLRGYGDSDKLSGISSYKMMKMVADLKQLIPALGYGSCTLVAHDWGGVIAWVFASLHQTMVDKLIVMNTVHPTAFQKYVEGHFSQFRLSWYVFFFHLPYIPELTFRISDYYLVSHVFRSREMGVLSGKLTLEDCEAYKYNISQPGALTCAVNYYRATTRHVLPKLDKVRCPVLTIWGCQDCALEKGLTSAAESVADNHTVRYIEDASHWVQMDAPETVNQYMRDFLA